MFLKFFLSYQDEIRGTSGSVSYGLKNYASTHATKKHVKTPATFNIILYNLCVGLCDESYRASEKNFSREILVNLSDEAMFQLEVKALSEYMYCTYNYQTKQIGFGNTKKQAYEATCDQSYISTLGSTGYYISDNEYMLDFYPPKKPEPEFLSLRCPDVFYEQVLNELNPYIKYEKISLFNKVSSILADEIDIINQYLNTNYIEGGQETYTGKNIPTQESKFVFRMFINDDYDIFNSDDVDILGKNSISEICFKIMQITNETF